ncbi:MAG: hypothetical protein EA412_01970 [Chitinophagaceae bacterium]|nr:MAG: hypothetical protein EA412_01970 [Chitinophagaceae bacterium]
MQKGLFRNITGFVLLARMLRTVGLQIRKSFGNHINFMNIKYNIYYFLYYIIFKRFQSDSYWNKLEKHDIATGASTAYSLFLLILIWMPINILFIYKSNFLIPLIGSEANNIFVFLLPVFQVLFTVFINYLIFIKRKTYISIESYFDNKYKLGAFSSGILIIIFIILCLSVLYLSTRI